MQETAIFDGFVIKWKNEEKNVQKPFTTAV